MLSKISETEVVENYLFVTQSRHNHSHFHWPKKGTTAYQWWGVGVRVGKKTFFIKKCGFVDIIMCTNCIIVGPFHISLEKVLVLKILFYRYCASTNCTNRCKCGSTQTGLKYTGRGYLQRSFNFAFISVLSPGRQQKELRFDNSNGF